MLEPRYYQIECNDSIFNYFTVKAGNPVCAVPTGLGKSVIISMFLMKAFYQYANQKVLVLTHVKELIEQNASELVGMWPNAPIGVNSASLKQRDFRQKIIFAGIASIYKDWEKFGKVDLILIDECHLLNPNDETMYKCFIECLLTINPYLKVIGFTATPWRLGHGLITENGIFTDFCYNITDMHSINRLISEGFMCPLIPRKTNYELDLTGVKLGQDGDYAKGALQIAVDKTEITYAALKEAREQGHDRHCWLVFASGIEHCEHIAEMLNELGISAATIHSKISTDERIQRIKDFKAGKITALVGFRVLTTGFNHPPIDLIVDLYPTTSSGMHVQKYGRGTRPYDFNDPQQYKLGFDYFKENCLVLDFAGNTKRLGPINDPVIPKKKGEKTGPAPVKICDVCGTYNHASARFCISCNNEFSLQVKITEQAGTNELIKVDLPIIETFKVDHITYKKHTKIGGLPSLKVTYYCNLRQFSEYVCVEHSGHPKHRANLWWQERSGGHKSPDAILNAMMLLDSLAKPTSINVVTNRKYPEVVEAFFDDRVSIKSFTEKFEDGTSEIVELNNAQSQWIEFDDTIPFGGTGATFLTAEEFLR